ncbi:phosphonate C-P lyase system protein PhnL [Sediminicurvatus halobius]|uniref:Phosphonate C-P lyase system protein PhnL n=1 Tax=Sediminicurvatus halobius TaxID=2182432 RepID=A0A2U2MWI3_9GAMM|nr:phosphonate C-P lyase system protein PhnL [Spiribacter halobius]PWG61204.1 phosphonate C-P lyase system protein PhnL [Spiribacter halobius]UEX77942.1 phosphonate C-P lyase system protein PhnL [Spiribacter halobius]
MSKARSGTTAAAEPAPEQPVVSVGNLHKTFTLHLQGGLELPVLRGVALDVVPGECVALTGPSGCGKSTLLRCLYGNYLPPAGSVHVRHRGEWLDLGAASPRQVVDLRRHTLGHVTQFLRAVPRVPAIELVAEPLLRTGHAPEAARARAEALLEQLHLPRRLWSLPPATFSGGEQQRVNIARGFAAGHPVLLLDEPTASLDAANRERVIELIRAALEGGAAIVGIFHDESVRNAVATRELNLDAGRNAA